MEREIRDYFQVSLKQLKPLDWNMTQGTFSLFKILARVGCQTPFQFWVHLHLFLLTATWKWNIRSSLPEEFPFEEAVFTLPCWFKKGQLPAGKGFTKILCNVLAKASRSWRTLASQWGCMRPLDKFDTWSHAFWQDPKIMVDWFIRGGSIWFDISMYIYG